MEKKIKGRERRETCFFLRKKGKDEGEMLQRMVLKSLVACVCTEWHTYESNGTDVRPLTGCRPATAAWCYVVAPCAQVFQGTQVKTDVAGNAAQVAIQRCAILPIGIPVVDLQGDQDAGDDQHDLTEGIEQVIPCFLVSDHFSLEFSQQT